MAGTDPQELTVALHLLESTEVNGDGGTGLEEGMRLSLGRSCGGNQFLRVFIDPVWVLFHCFVFVCCLFVCSFRVEMKQDCLVPGRFFLGSDGPFRGATGS